MGENRKAERSEPIYKKAYYSEIFLEYNSISLWFSYSPLVWVEDFMLR